MTPASIVTLVVGLAVLLFGRRLFWLFVGAVGFAAGAGVGAALFPDQPEWLILLVALGIGLLGAWLATVVEVALVGVASFFAGAYAGLSLLRLFGAGQDWQLGLAALVGGVVGLVLALSSFDQALMLLSATTGAALLVQTPILTPMVSRVAFVLLVILGVAFQWLGARQTPRRRG